VTSWNAPAKFFHWLVAVLVLAQIALGLAAIGWSLSPTKLNLYVWHKSLGLLILAVMALRLLWRLTHPGPGLPEGTPAWENSAARASHFLLYALLIALPLSGWVIASASGIPFRIFWQVPLPEIVTADKATADVAARVHFWLLVAFVPLLVLHAGAALRHHYIKRNDVLRRMLPFA
jgi:cytochrome b561